MKEVEIEASELLLDKGVRVQIRTPFFMSWLVKHFGITVKRPVLGTMMRISNLYLKMDVEIEKIDAGDLKEAHRLLAEHGVNVSRIVAMGMIRGRVTGTLLSKLLGWYLRWSCDAISLAKIAVLLIQLSGVQHFTNTIRFLSAMKMTTPRNQSPEEKGSQQAE